MSDEFEDLLKRWMRNRAGTDRSVLEGLAGHVAALPPRRQRRPSSLATAAAIVLALGLAAVVLGPRFGSVSSESGSSEPSAQLPTPSGPAGAADPSAFPSPERLAPCGGLTEHVQFAFEIPSAKNFPRHFPAMTQSIEQLADVPAIVVVYRGYNPFGVAGQPGSLFTRPPLGPNERDVCVILETPRPTGPLQYEAVDISGLRVILDEPSPGATTTASPSPAPAWITGAAAALGCDGEPSGYGIGWRRGDLGTRGQATADAALQDFLERVGLTTTAFPTRELRRIDETADASVYAYGYRGASRAIVIVRRDASSVPRTWWVADVASCDPSELGPDFPLDADVGIWRDATGALVPATRLTERMDCYRGTKLVLDGRLYVWDPNLGRDAIYDPSQLDDTVAVLTELPAGAIDTGLVGGGRRLYLAADGTAAFMVRTDAVQRWPHVKGDAYQRIDCN